MNSQHVPVLLDEAVHALNLSHGKIYVDGTVGGGGHTKKICEYLDASNLMIGIDQDPIALKEAEKNLTKCKSPLRLIHGNFGNISQILSEVGIFKVDGGILLDLGVSAFQLQDKERGFSFRQKSALDMRMNPKLEITAEILVNKLPEQELANLLYRNADEKLSRPLAAAIVKSRPIKNTMALALIAENVYRKKGIKHHNIHPATRMFQALRIEVNREIEMLEHFLEQLPVILLPEARIAIITFHSIEDRTVKQYFKKASAGCICSSRQPICTCSQVPVFKTIGKLIKPTDFEIEKNPQARSSHLRVYERL